MEHDEQQQEMPQIFPQAQEVAIQTFEAITCHDAGEKEIFNIRLGIQLFGSIIYAELGNDEELRHNVFAAAVQAITIVQVLDELAETEKITSSGHEEVENTITYVEAGIRQYDRDLLPHDFLSPSIIEAAQLFVFSMLREQREYESGDFDDYLETAAVSTGFPFIMSCVIHAWNPEYSLTDKDNEVILLVAKGFRLLLDERTATSDIEQDKPNAVLLLANNSQQSGEEISTQTFDIIRDRTQEIIAQLPNQDRSDITFPTKIALSVIQMGLKAFP